MGSIALSAKSVGSEERPPKEVLPCMLSPPFDREKLPFSLLAGYVFRAKQIIAQYYAKPAAYSYFVGCSTGGREGMILSQRYPTVFNGIVSGDPAMRTGLSNLAIGKWIPVAYNQAAPKDASGKPLIDKLLTDGDRKLFMEALMDRCDAKDGVADGMISDPHGLRFRSCGAGLQERPERRLHCAREDCGHQESLCGTQELLRNPGVPRFSVRRRYRGDRSDSGAACPRRARPLRSISDRD